jgi:hypothetical protein
VKTNPLRIVRQCWIAGAAGMLFFSNHAVAQAVDLGTGTVTWMETTYMPGDILFKLSSGAGLCPAGTELHYQHANADNMKAAMAILLANMLSGRQAYVYYHTSTVSTGGVVLPGQCRVHHVGTR